MCYADRTFSTKDLKGGSNWTPPPPRKNMLSKSSYSHRTVLMDLNKFPSIFQKVQHSHSKHKKRTSNLLKFDLKGKLWFNKIWPLEGGRFITLDYGQILGGIPKMLVYAIFSKYWRFQTTTTTKKKSSYLPNLYIGSEIRLTHTRTGFIFRIKSLNHQSNWQHIFLISFNCTSKSGVMHYK